MSVGVGRIVCVASINAAALTVWAALAVDVAFFTKPRLLAVVCIVAGGEVAARVVADGFAGIDSSEQDVSSSNNPTMKVSQE